jgi:transcriptional repressor NrdR
MRCPRCGHLEDRVIDSRQSREGDSIRRRRECEGCGARFTSYERIEQPVPLIIKRDGRREAYLRDKLVAGLRRACEKRPVSSDAIEALVDRVEARLAELGDPEVPSRTLGDVVMAELERLDQVAWLRFASVYRSFQEVGEFFQAAERLRLSGQADAAASADEEPK